MADRRSLIDTRQGRKREHDDDASSIASKRHNNLPHIPNKHLTQWRPNTDLGSMLWGDSIPYEKYRSIQNSLNKQDKMLTDRGKEIERLCSRIHDLKKDAEDRQTMQAKIDRLEARLERRNKQVDGLEKELKNAKDYCNQRIEEKVLIERERDEAHQELRERKKYFENSINEKHDFLRLGTKALAGKNEQTEALAAEIKTLRATANERDMMISSLNDQIICLNNQIICMATSTGDGAVTMAVEAQAQQTLGLVNNLKADVAGLEKMLEKANAENENLTAANERLTIAKKDLKNALEDTTAKNEDLDTENGNLTAKNAFLSSTNEKLNTTNESCKDALKKASDTVEKWKAAYEITATERDSLIDKVAAAEKEVEAAQKRAREAQAISEEQNKLIDKLLLHGNE